MFSCEFCRTFFRRTLPMAASGRNCILWMLYNYFRTPRAGSSLPHAFYKTFVQKSFAKFTRKHLQWSPIYIKVADQGPQTFYMNRTQFFRIAFLQNTWRRCFYRANPAGIYLLKLSNRNNRAMCKICSKLTIKTPE